jgi:hypothetical protein
MGQKVVRQPNDGALVGAMVGARFQGGDSVIGKVEKQKIQIE